MPLFLGCFLYRTQLFWFKLLACPTPCYHWTNKTPILTNSWISRNPKQTSRNKGQKWNLLIKMHEVLQPEEKLVKKKFKKKSFHKNFNSPRLTQAIQPPQRKTMLSIYWATIQKNDQTGNLNLGPQYNSSPKTLSLPPTLSKEKKKEKKNRKKNLSCNLSNYFYLFSV